MRAAYLRCRLGFSSCSASRVVNFRGLKRFYFDGSDITRSPLGVVCTVPDRSSRGVPAPTFTGIETTLDRPACRVVTFTKYTPSAGTVTRTLATPV